jgi:hypothetical protein
MVDKEIFLVKSGKIIIYRLYDVAYEINLLKVEERLKKESRRLKIERKPFSKAFEFANPPITFQLSGFKKEIMGDVFDVNVYSKIYDYGVLSIILEIPVKDINIYDYEGLAFYLEEDEEINNECKKRLDQVISILEGAFVGFSVSKFEEDYTIFFIEGLYPEVSFAEFLKKYDISRLLFYEKGILFAGDKE